MMNLAEWAIILLVAVVVIKPERLPEIAYWLGRFVARCRLWYSHILGKYNQFM